MTSRRGMDRGLDLPDWLEPPVDTAASRSGRVDERRSRDPPLGRRSERREAERARRAPSGAPSGARAAPAAPPLTLAPGVLERRLLVFATVLLLLYGLVMAYSASTAQAYFDYGSSFYFVKQAAHLRRHRAGRHVHSGARRLHLVSPSGAALRGRRRRVAAGRRAGARASGPSSNGARRWIIVGGQSLTPSELAKLACVMLVAALIANRPANVLEAQGFGETGRHRDRAGRRLLIMLEPDLGTTLSSSWRRGRRADRRRRARCGTSPRWRPAGLALVIGG